MLTRSAQGGLSYWDNCGGEETRLPKQEQAKMHRQVVLDKVGVVDRYIKGKESRDKWCDNLLTKVNQRDQMLRARISANWKCGICY